MTRKRQKAVKYVIYDLKNDVNNICNNTRMWMDGVVVRVEGGWQHHCVKFWLDLHRWSTVSMQSVKINTSMYSASLSMHYALSKVGKTQWGN